MIQKVDLDMEFEKFKENYTGNNLEEDWQDYQCENELYDLSSNINDINEVQK